MLSALKWDGFSTKTISGRFLNQDKAEEFPRGKLEADITEILSRFLLRFLVELVEFGD